MLELVCTMIILMNVYIGKVNHRFVLLQIQRHLDMTT